MKIIKEATSNDKANSKNTRRDEVVRIVKEETNSIIGLITETLNQRGTDYH